MTVVMTVIVLLPRFTGELQPLAHPYVLSPHWSQSTCNEHFTGTCLYIDAEDKVLTLV